MDRGVTFRLIGLFCFVGRMWKVAQLDRDNDNVQADPTPWAQPKYDLLIFVPSKAS